jgi:hypothetical protein
MAFHLGTGRSTSLKMSVSALYVPSRGMAGCFVAEAKPRQKACLGKCESHEL